MSETTAADQTPNQRTFLGHPIGLYVLFFTEMWERFSYYGMRALLVLYMVNFFKWTQDDASKIYKWYTALVYLTPLLGGFMADRYLGNRMAIIIGAVLMAIGHFLMAFEELWIFYAALGFLIFGNGFFKPNMSVQVGRLYPQNDPRRDGAYTIFYMGINIGAFLAPLICGALKDTPAFGFHWGFGAAGVGMVLGLLTYLFGLPFIKELPEGMVYQGPDAKTDDTPDDALTEAEAAKTPSVLGWLGRMSTYLIYGAGLLFIVGAPIGWSSGFVSFDNMIASVIAGVSFFFAGWIVSNLEMAVRDRVLAIYALFIFVVFFWAAFEQAGNAMNVWADQTTNRYLTETPPEPELFPSAPVDLKEEGLVATMGNAFAKIFQINPVLTTSFQSINAFAIVVFAPLFAWLWLFLAERNINVSIAMKMALGVFLQGLAFSLMIWAALYETRPSETSLSSLPASMVIKEDGAIHFFDAPNYGDTAALEAFGTFDPEKSETMIAQGGRMTFADGKLTINGVMDENHRDRILRGTVNKDFLKQIHDFVAETKKQKAAAAGGSFTVQTRLENLPAGFEPRYLQGFRSSELSFDPATNTLTATAELADKDFKQILLTGSDPEIRRALNDLFVQSAKFKVGSSWLFWFYILCTLGELCLSPVGLSMVSKLAPRKFATMLMGMWLLTSFFGNFAAGLAGENWEMLEPQNYFLYVSIAMLGAAAVCFLLTHLITKMMHGVK